MESHYHTLDRFNGERFTHRTRVDLDWYLSGTGMELMRVRPCTSPECLVDDDNDEDDY